MKLEIGGHELRRGNVKKSSLESARPGGCNGESGWGPQAGAASLIKKVILSRRVTGKDFFLPTGSRKLAAESQ
jgi:hypothetical protein